MPIGTCLHGRYRRIGAPWKHAFENKIGKINNEIGNIDNKPSLVVFLGFFDDQNNQAVVLTFCGL